MGGVANSSIRGFWSTLLMRERVLTVASCVHMHKLQGVWSNISVLLVKFAWCLSQPLVSVISIVCVALCAVVCRWGAVGRVCRHCKLEEGMRTWEARLFQLSTKALKVGMQVRHMQDFPPYHMLMRCNMKCIVSDKT